MREINTKVVFSVGYLKPVVSHTIVIGSCPLMQMSLKNCIVFWIHVIHTCTLGVPIFVSSVCVLSREVMML